MDGIHSPTCAQRSNWLMMFGHGMDKVKISCTKSMGKALPFNIFNITWYRAMPFFEDSLFQDRFNHARPLLQQFGLQKAQRLGLGLGGGHVGSAFLHARHVCATPMWNHHPWVRCLRPRRLLRSWAGHTKLPCPTKSRENPCDNLHRKS